MSIENPVPMELVENGTCKRCKGELNKVDDLTDNGWVELYYCETCNEYTPLSLTTEKGAK